MCDTSYSASPDTGCGMLGAGRRVTYLELRRRDGRVIRVDRLTAW